eukprot:1156503-Pelagomonas_calceolata.AAC.13
MDSGSLDVSVVEKNGTQHDNKSLKALQRSRALTFEEFLDALCHVADMISPPPVPELLAIGCSEHHPTTNYFMKVCNEESPLRRQDCCNQGAQILYRFTTKVAYTASWTASRMVCNEGSPLRRRDSVAIRAPKTRPLDEKLEQCCPWIFGHATRQSKVDKTAYVEDRGSLERKEKNSYAGSENTPHIARMISTILFTSHTCNPMEYLGANEIQ